MDETQKRKRLGIIGIPGFKVMSNDGSEVLWTEPPSPDFRVVYQDPSTDPQSPSEQCSPQQSDS